ncbi:MAG: hypothetical protein WDW38_000626 [Sanguina aurantia]
MKTVFLSNPLMAPSLATIDRIPAQSLRMILPHPSSLFQTSFFNLTSTPATLRNLLAHSCPITQHRHHTRTLREQQQQQGPALRHKYMQCSSHTTQTTLQQQCSSPVHFKRSLCRLSTRFSMQQQQQHTYTLALNPLSQRTHSSTATLQQQQQQCSTLVHSRPRSLSTCSTSLQHQQQHNRTFNPNQFSLRIHST